MSAASIVREVAQRITFGGGMSLWSPCFNVRKADDDAIVQLRLTVPDRETGALIPIVLEDMIWQMDLLVARDPHEVVLTRLRIMIERAALHEMNESVRLDGKLARDAHGGN